MAKTITSAASKRTARSVVDKFGSYLAASKAGKRTGDFVVVKAGKAKVVRSRRKIFDGVSDPVTGKVFVKGEKNPKGGTSGYSWRGKKR